MSVDFLVKCEENLRAQTGVHFIEAVCLIWGPRNARFTLVIFSDWF